MIRLSEASVNQRVVEMTARFDNIGETVVRDEGGATRYRWLQWAVVALYRGVELGSFQFDEYYERDGGGWAMVKYAYDFVEMTRSSRLAFHSHPLLRTEPTPHVHCEPELGHPAHDHYRFDELTIYEALEEHLKWWAADTDLTCEELRPLLNY